MNLTADFIQDEIRKQTYEISVHADDERLADGLSISELEFALLSCRIIEDYPNDPRGASCLALGHTSQEKAVHVVCGRNKSGHLVIITVYLPAMPKWLDPVTRNR